MEKNIRSIGFFGYFILCLYSSCSLSTAYYEENSYPVEINDGLFDQYYQSFMVRFRVWERRLSIPVYAMRDGRWVDPRPKFYEFPSTEDTTCYFSPPDSIYIGADKWQSGCVPHEIGHFVLYTVGHPCWGEFEHEEEDERCKGRY